MQDRPDKRAFFSRLNAQQYEQKLVPVIFRPWAERLLRQLEASEGSRLLDLACGTGILARTLAKQRPDLELYGLDLSEDMLAVARKQSSTVHWLNGHALHLPWPDGFFQRIACQQGLQFVPQRPAVLDEIHRVLQPGGQLVAACWQTVADNGAYAALLAWSRRHDFQGLAEFIEQIFSWPAERLAPALEDAGFHPVAVQVEKMETRFPSVAYFLDVFSQVPPLQPDWQALTEPQQQALLAELEQDCQPWCTESGLCFPMSSSLIRATRPSTQ